MATPQVDIIWNNGHGAELDRVTVKDDGDKTVSDALVKLVSGSVVSPGDTFEIRAVQS